MADIVFYADMTNEDGDLDTIRLALAIHRDDDNGLCEYCDDPITNGQLIIHTNDYPYDYCSAITSHAHCLTTTELSDFRPLP